MGSPHSAVVERRLRPGGVVAVVLSIAFHLLVVLFLIWRGMPVSAPIQETVSVSVVEEKQPEDKPPPPPEPAPEPKPQPQPTPKIEKPKAELPKPLPPQREAAPKPRPPEPKIRSAKPRRIGRAEPSPALSVEPLHLGGQEPGAEGTAGEAMGSPFDEKAVSTLRDIMLSQVVRHWRPPAGLRGRNFVVQLVVEVLPGGMLGTPFAADRQLDIEHAVASYDTLSPDLQETMYRLVQALRVAQPFSLPADAMAKTPFLVRLDFAFDQIP